jgi:hypothetical protein
MSFVDRVARIRDILGLPVEMTMPAVVISALPQMGVKPEASWALPQMVAAIELAMDAPRESPSNAMVGCAVGKAVGATTADAETLTVVARADASIVTTELFVEADVADAVVAEAIQIGDEQCATACKAAEERAAAAEERATAAEKRAAAAEERAAAAEQRAAAAEEWASAAEELTQQLKTTMELQLLERAEERGAQRERAARCAAEEALVRAESSAEELLAQAEAARQAAEERAAAAEASKAAEVETCAPPTLQQSRIEACAPPTLQQSRIRGGGGRGRGSWHGRGGRGVHAVSGLPRARPNSGPLRPDRYNNV